MKMMKRKASVATLLAEKRIASLETARLKAIAEAEEQEALEEKKRLEDEREETERHHREMELAGGFRKYKTAINSLTKIMHTFELTDDNRKDLEDHIAEYTKLLVETEPLEIDINTIESHMAFLSSDPMLVQVMRLWWAGIMPYLGTDQCLDRGGYDVLQTALQFALNGNLNEEVATMYCEEQFARDKIHYNTERFNQKQVYDILYDVCTTWLEVFSAQSYTCFLWALLDSIFDTDNFPLKIRLKRCITHIPIIPEGTLFQYWFNSKNKIHRLVDLVVEKLAQDSRRAEQALMNTNSSHRRMSVTARTKSEMKIDRSLDNVVWNVTVDPNILSSEKKGSSRAQRKV